MATISSSLFLKQKAVIPSTHLAFPSIRKPHLPNRTNFHNLSLFINKSANFSTRIYVPNCSNFTLRRPIINRKQQQLQHCFNWIDDEPSSVRFDGDAVVASSADAIIRLFKTLTKPAIIAVLLSAFMLVCDPYNAAAFAASGGRMGGSSFSSRRSSSSTSCSSSPSSSHRSTASPSSSYRSGVSPYASPSSSYRAAASPSFNIKKRRKKEKVYEIVGPSTSSLSPTMEEEAWTVIDILFISIFFILPVTVFVMVFFDDPTPEKKTSVKNSVGNIATETNARNVCAEETSVIKLQVGLLGSARSIQRDLNRIAEVADTTAPEGLSYVLTETTVALLRHPDFCISGHSSIYVKQSMQKGEKQFNQLSIEERAKFDEETLVNVNNIKRKSTSSQSASGSSNEYIVVTILVAAEGKHKVPAITSISDLKEALQKLGSITVSETMAVEILWTPQAENDSLSELELLKDYPLLRLL